MQTNLEAKLQELYGGYEKLDNGLEVYLMPMENKDKYFAYPQIL